MEAGVGDRLSGWKEIAQHLRRSVRSVQRWERELGLPVQRVRTAHGQVVYGSRSALDAWMARFAELPPDTQELTEDDSASAVGGSRIPEAAALATALAPVRPAFRWWYAGGLVVAAVTVITVVAISQPSIVRRGSQPMDLSIAGQTLEAHNPVGELLWSYVFDAGVSTEDRHIPTVRRASVSTNEVDLDGNGHLEYLVPVTFGSPTQSHHDVLYAFSDSGHVLWSLKGDQVLSCGGEPFKAPWRISSVVVSSGPSPKRVWVSLNHHTWWPSVVLEVAPDGAQTMRYVQAGWIDSMTEWTTAGKSVLVVGGVINEWARASVALVDPEGPVSMLPASDQSYRCDVQGAKSPRQVTLFPPHEASRALGDPYVRVGQLSLQDQSLRVEIDGGRAVAVMEPDTTVSSFEMTDKYWLLHDTTARAGTLDHMALDCPERNSPREIRTWTLQQLWRTVLVGRAGNRSPTQR